MMFFLVRLYFFSWDKIIAKFHIIQFYNIERFINWFNKKINVRNKLELLQSVRLIFYLYFRYKKL